MIERLNQQINEINQLLDKLPTTQGELAEQQFVQLMEERRKLKTLHDAVADNPGIGVYGVRGTRRGHLTHTLLKRKDSPFMVSDGQGNKYNLVKEIKPITEQFTTIMRFSSYSRNPESYSEKYPVQVRLLSVADIIMLLSDFYYNDHKDYGKFTLKWSDVEDISRNIREEFISAAPLPDPNLTADDVLNIKTYFSKHIGRAANYASSSCTFFDSIAVVIDRIPSDEFVYVFSTLWNNDKNISRLFTFFFDILKSFNFAKSIYLPLETVLHHHRIENTIFGREGIIYWTWHPEKYTDTTDTYTKENNEFVKCAGNVPKGAICAVAAEVIFKIEEEFYHAKGIYDFTNIADEVSQRIGQEEKELSILRDCDLIYLPPAYSRYNYPVKYLEIDDRLFFGVSHAKTVYLFNKFSDEKRINILLYCHHHQLNEVNTIPGLLREWVHTYVGDTPEKRSATVAKAEGSPLFYIATMFNIDMKERKSAADDINGLNNRWEGRFETVLLGECFGGTEEWVNDWISPNNSFNNSYLFRELEYSEDLYAGYRENNIETVMRMNADYYKLMRHSFITHPVVCKFFSDPALSWDVAATQNNDGSLYIIENLQRVGSKIGKVREEQFNEQIEQVRARIQELGIEV